MARAAYTRKMGRDDTGNTDAIGQRRREQRDDGDHVDRVREAWAREWPELDTSSVAVIGRIGRLAAYLDVGLERAFRRYGLSRAGWDVLAALRRGGPPYRLPQKALMGELMRASGTVSFRVDRLERAGWVRREPDPTDGRNVFVALTEAGYRLVDDVAPAHLANEERLLAALAPAERATLADLLRTLLRGFESPADAPMPGP